MLRRIQGNKDVGLPLRFKPSAAVCDFRVSYFDFRRCQPPEDNS
jgi:hypothetical protein